MLARHGYGVLLSTAAARAQRGRPNVFGWGGGATSLPPPRTLHSRPTSTTRGSGPSACRSAAKLIHAAAHRTLSRRSSPRGERTVLRDELANPGLAGRLLDLPTQVTLTAAVAVLTNVLPPPSLQSEVAKIAPTPVFFIYGEHGQGGTETRPNKAFYAAAREPKQIWEVPAGQHIAGITTRPAEYERRVVAFLDHALLPTD
jgi:hypothetical protein